MISGLKMNNRFKLVIELAAQIVASREADVEDENGSLATVSINDLIFLEDALVEAFQLSSDEVKQSDLQMIKDILKHQ